MVGLRHRQVDLSQPIRCGSGVPVDYDLPLHVGSLFIILFVSATGCSFSLLVTKVPKLKIPPTLLFIIRHFGTGVLLATAFVHLLPTAFVSLTDPCLPPFWNETYPAMAGALALLAVFFLTIIEMIFSPGRHFCVTTVQGPNLKSSTQGSEKVELPAQVPRDEMPKGPLYGRSLSGRSQSIGQGLNRVVVQDHDQIDNVHTAVMYQDQTRAMEQADVVGAEIEDDAVADKAVVEERQKALIQCVMLEMGILFHSIFIGMALAVATGKDQITLLIAIVFHQTFEGLALGSRIAAVGWEPKALQPWIMAFLYGCTTPLGQAIGIGTRNLYNPDSQTGLLVVGIMNAISSGFLTFNSLVDLMSEDFLSDSSWKHLRGSRRKLAFSLVVFGAFCMSLVGAWA